MTASNINSVFYAESYHPIQVGSIDGTDILPHDHAVYRASLCSSAGLYDPFGDPKVVGDPYCTIFVGRLSRLTTEDTLHKTMSTYGRVKNLRLVRDIVTGASRGYAFVEFETEREMRRAYREAHHSFIDDCEIIIDYNRQNLMPGWIPRRLGGGLGGKKESGQLRFGGRERPFRAPLRPIPYEELKKLGILPPPKGRYMSRHQVPSPPRRGMSFFDHEESSDKSKTVGHLRGRSSMEREEHHYKRRSIDGKEHAQQSSAEVEESYKRRSSRDQEGSPEYKMSGDRRGGFVDNEDQSYKMSSRSRDDTSSRRNTWNRKDHTHRHHRHSSSKLSMHKRRRSYSSSLSPGI